jgi:hypothetical protein
MPSDEQDKAGVIAPPPLIYLVAPDLRPAAGQEGCGRNLTTSFACTSAEASWYSAIPESAEAPTLHSLTWSA